MYKLIYTKKNSPHIIQQNTQPHQYQKKLIFSFVINRLINIDKRVLRDFLQKLTTLNYSKRIPYNILINNKHNIIITGILVISPIL